MKKNRMISLLVSVLILVGAVGCSADREKVLSNPNSGEMTKEIYSYLCSVEGKSCLSAQQESTWMDSTEYETDYVYSASGKYPAIRGLDYMNDDFQGVNERALDWWHKGGLVTVCWHTGSDFLGAWKEAMETEITDWDKTLTDGTAENKALLDGMDKAAKALSELKEKGVTVIWRPFHEADGGWFWWGKGGSDNFVKLWRLMYERYTGHWKLDNLIWVQGFSHNGEKIKEWYVGDSYCDIIGADSYDGGAQPELYETVKKLNTDKPICFHECGDNPTESQLKETPWLWFMTWHTEYLIDNNTKDEINELYNSDYIITLDELPDFLKENITEMADTDIILNEDLVFEVEDLLDATDWLGKKQGEFDVPDEYIQKNGSFKEIVIKSSLFGADCDAKAYFSFNHSDEDEYVKSILTFVSDLTFDEGRSNLEALYGKPVSEGEEPYVEVLGGVVTWAKYETDEYTVSIETASKHDFITVEFKTKMKNA